MIRESRAALPAQGLRIILLEAAIAMASSSLAMAAEVTIHVVDQNQVTILDSHTQIGGIDVAEGGTAILDPGDYLIRIFPGVNGNTQWGHLYRDDAVHVTSDPAQTLTFTWKTASLVVDLLDQYGVRIPGSRWAGNVLVPPRPVGSPEIILPVTEDPEKPVTGGTQMDGYEIFLYPGINANIQGGHLVRTERCELTPAGEDVAYTWKTAPVVVDLLDQFGVRIPGSQWAGSPYIPAHAVGLPEIILPVTEDLEEPVTGGSEMDGYQISVYPGINGNIQGGHLMRTERCELTPAGEYIAYTWKTAPLVVDLLDQFGVRIPGSQWAGSPYIPAHAVGLPEIILPVTEDLEEPVTGGSQMDGYEFSVYPGITGVVQGGHLGRSERYELTPAGGNTAYTWKMAPLVVDLSDQFDNRIPSSRWTQLFVPLRPVGLPEIILPVTEDPEEPVTAGTQKDGYEISLYPGINGIVQSAYLVRYERYELTPAGGTSLYWWKSGIGTLHVADSTGVQLPESAFSIGGELGSGPSGTLVHLPVTEDAGMAVPGGLYASGYLMGIRLHDDSPFTFFTFELDSTYMFSPSLVEVDGVACGLRLNLPSACCLPTGECMTAIESVCSGIGGDWYPDIAACDPGPCTPKVVVTAGDWVDPEPWHDWVSDAGDEGIPVQAHVPDHAGAIEHVEFYYSTDNGANWVQIADDTDGYEPPLNTIDSSVPMRGCGWSTEFVAPDSLPAGPIQFLSVAHPVHGEAVADTTARIYDPLPPSMGTTSIVDRQIIDRDALGTDIFANGADIERIIIHRSPMDTTFVKGVPGIWQLPFDSLYCAPTAAAQCLQYFAGTGDSLLTGGLTTSALVEGLAAYMGTNQAVAGTLPSHWIGGVGQWIGSFGAGYSVRSYGHYACDGSGCTWTLADWQRIRNELELCRDVLVGVFWDWGGGHALTLDAIYYPENEDSSITIGFQDPWTGASALGDLKPDTGRITNLGGAGGNGGGQIGLTMVVAPQDSVVGGGIAGELVQDVVPSSWPYHLEIPIPTEGYWFIHVTLVDSEGHAYRVSNVIERDDDATGVQEASAVAPLAFSLGRCVPNPSQGTTRISYAVPRLAWVRLAIYDVAGRRVRTLQDGELSPGRYEALWDGKDQRGRASASGIYYLKMTAPEYEQTTRLTVIR